MTGRQYYKNSTKMIIITLPPYLVQYKDSREDSLAALVTCPSSYINIIELVGNKFAKSFPLELLNKIGLPTARLCDRHKTLPITISMLSLKLNRKTYQIQMGRGRIARSLVGFVLARS